MTDEAKRFLILGTAGHIDHGKTSLIRRLTGIDTDRLPEEKQRGITIDLGFANLDLPGLRFGIVDVPGHERFVHNMVAGASGIDLVLFVVAADDSVMPQTTEHLAILNLLGVDRGVIAITKCDLVDRDYLDLATEEVRELFSDTLLRDAPIVPVSSTTGEGIGELLDRLREVAEGYARPVRRNIFRLPIDRVFSVAGHGTVVTGTVHSGRAAVGEHHIIMPRKTAVRIRNLQSHNSSVDTIEAGQRAAVNLAGCRSDELQRGDELVVEGYLEPAQRLFARLDVLQGAPKPVADRQLFRLHMGTREATVRVVSKGQTILPGSSGFVEFRCRDLLLADYGQRFILRQLSPVVTIGGGIILDPAVSPRRRLGDFSELGQRLSHPEPIERLSAYLETSDIASDTPLILACRLGIEPADLPDLLEQLHARKALVKIGGAKGVAIHKSRRETLGEQIVVRCQRELKRRQPSRSLERATLLHACRHLASAPVLEALIDDLLARELMVRVGEKISPAGQRATLTKNQQKWHDTVIAMCAQGALSPPLLTEIAKTIGQPIKEIEVLARIAVEDRRLVRIGEDLYLAPGAVEAARSAAVACLREKGGATVADLRDAWGVSRKYAVPFCEFFDGLGVTRREGDLRRLGPNADVPLADAQ